MKIKLLALVLIASFLTSPSVLAASPHAKPHTVVGRLKSDLKTAVVAVRKIESAALTDFAKATKASVKAAKKSSELIREGFHAAVVTVIETIILTDLAALELRLI